MTATKTQSDWTKTIVGHLRINLDGSSYLAVRPAGEGRFTLEFRIPSPDGRVPKPIVLCKGTLAKCKEFADTHHAGMIASAQAGEDDPEPVVTAQEVWVRNGRIYPTSIMEEALSDVETLSDVIAADNPSLTGRLAPPEDDDKDDCAAITPPGWMEGKLANSPGSIPAYKATAESPREIADGIAKNIITKLTPGEQRRVAGNLYRGLERGDRRVLRKALSRAGRPDLAGAR